jgi:4'-phosphopantetheinyl transferase
MILDSEKISADIRFMDPAQNDWKPGRDVHIWKLPAVQMVSSLLTPAENEFAGRFRFEDDRNRFAVGRHALRLLLSNYLSVSPASFSISTEMGQRPLISNLSAQMHFNISHSGEWVLVAFAKEELGIDIEKIDTDFAYEDILPDHFSEAEQAFVLSAADPTAAFYYLWTRKEALTKAWGTGLQENLKQVAVLDEDSLMEMNNKSWKLESFHLSAFYPAAIAFSAALENIHYFDGANLVGKP